MEEEQERRVHIDISELLKRESIFKFVRSTRSDGKTTALSCDALRTYETTGKKPLFFRRWPREIETGDFLKVFGQNIATAAPDLVAGRRFEIQGGQRRGWHFMITDEGGDELKPAIGIYPISTAYRQKSGFDHAINKNLYFDEYIPLDNRYTVNEMINILELYQTVDRKHYDNYFVFAANSVIDSCPFFTFFGVKNPKKNGISTYKNGAIDILTWRNKHNAKRDRESKFGDLISGTEYEGYNYGETLINHNAAIMPKHYNTVFYNILQNGRLFAAFLGENCIVLGSAKERAKNAPTVAINACNKEFDGVIDLKQCPPALNFLRAYKYTNRLFFDSEETLHTLEKFYKAI